MERMAWLPGGRARGLEDGSGRTLGLSSWLRGEWGNLTGETERVYQVTRKLTRGGRHCASHRKEAARCFSEGPTKSENIPQTESVQVSDVLLVKETSR